MLQNFPIGPFHLVLTLSYLTPTINPGEVQNQLNVNDVMHIGQYYLINTLGNYMPRSTCTLKER